VTSPPNVSVEQIVCKQPPLSAGRASGLRTSVQRFQNLPTTELADIVKVLQVATESRLKSK
jgi:hypothetical protein